MKIKVTEENRPELDNNPVVSDEGEPVKIARPKMPKIKIGQNLNTEWSVEG